MLECSLMENLACVRLLYRRDDVASTKPITSRTVEKTEIFTNDLT